MRDTLDWRTPAEALDEVYDRLTQAVLRRPVELGQYLSIRYTERVAHRTVGRERR